MIKYFFVLPIVILLTGCPGKGREGAETGERQSIYIDNGRVCFTVNKKDILSRYVLSTNGSNYKELLVGDGVRLSYPDSCFSVSLEKGIIYGVSYTLNEKNYYYTFILDNDGNVLDLKGE
ncbi:putative T6SS immunity periplasmic lipoprotein [Phytobacter palmae]|uniref:T6SS immunity periplasmic lipoprotein n=1 Tax=Phytobacter palmae TaxID=1855371 RepID=A0ABU9V6Q8_9ENTR